MQITYCFKYTAAIHKHGRSVISVKKKKSLLRIVQLYFEEDKQVSTLTMASLMLFYVRVIHTMSTYEKDYSPSINNDSLLNLLNKKQIF